MKLILVLLSFLVFAVYGQQSAKGNYLMINKWSLSFIQLHKNSEVIWYTRGCTDRGTDHLGTWSQHGDTVEIVLDWKTTTFILREKTLCHLKDDGELAPVEQGIPRTAIQSKWRVHHKARSMRKR